MQRFFEWFNTDCSIDPVLKAGLAHFWFVTIHPFEDGNGRIGRAIADMALARSEKSSRRFYSMSAQIRQERDDYYRIPQRSRSRAARMTSGSQFASTRSMLRPRSHSETRCITSSSSMMRGTCK